MLSKEVQGYEGLYVIYEDGTIKSLLTGKILRAYDHGGYRRVALRRKREDGSYEQKQHLVHRLLAQAFIPNPDNLPEIDHKDGNRANNAISNLRWCTTKENINNPVTIARYKANWRNEAYRTMILNSKLHVNKPVQCIETGEVWLNQATAARENGVRLFTVQGSCKRYEQGRPMQSVSRSGKPVKHYKYITLEEYNERATA